MPVKELAYSKTKGNQAKSKSCLFPCPLYRLPPERVAQIKGIASYLKKIRIKGRSSYFK